MQSSRNDTDILYNPPSNRGFHSLYHHLFYTQSTLTRRIDKLPQAPASIPSQANEYQHGQAPHPYSRVMTFYHLTAANSLFFAAKTQMTWGAVLLSFPI